MLLIAKFLLSLVLALIHDLRLAVARTKLSVARTYCWCRETCETKTILEQSSPLLETEVPHFHESLGICRIRSLLVAQQELAASQAHERHNLLPSLKPAFDKGALGRGLHSCELEDLRRSVPGPLGALQAAEAEPYYSTVLLHGQTAPLDDPAALGCSLHGPVVQTYLLGLLQEGQLLCNFINTTFGRRLAREVAGPEQLARTLLGVLGHPWDRSW